MPLLPRAPPDYQPFNILTANSFPLDGWSRTLHSWGTVCAARPLKTGRTADAWRPRCSVRGAGTTIPRRRSSAASVVPAGGRLPDLWRGNPPEQKFCGAVGPR